VRTAVAIAALAAAVSLTAQESYEQTIADLASGDAGVRLKAVQMLKDAAYGEAAVPLARTIGDPQDAVQLESIAAELNIFLAEKVVTRRRIGLVVEKRAAIGADAAFSAGPLALGPAAVPLPVLAALRAAIRDDNPRVGLEALYAFGTLAPSVEAAARARLLDESAAELVSLIGAADPPVRYGVLRVIGRVFARRPGGAPVQQSLGDAVIVALNDRDDAVKGAAMAALGALRYERAVEALTALFEFHGRGAAAEASLDALARIASPVSAPLFAAQLASKAAAIRGIAVEGLGRVGDRSQADAVRAATRAERGDGVLLAAAFAAVLLSDAPVDPLAEALMKPRLHDQAKAYLVEIAPGRTASLSRQAQDPDARMRREIADVLGLAGDPAALALVEPMVKDGDTAVANAAAAAVGRLRRAAAR
jgi:HEAT repeat protein